MLFNFPVEGLPCLGTLLRSPGFVLRVCLLPGFALGGPAWGMAMKLGCGEAQTAERDEPHSRTATRAPHPSILHQRFHLCSQESSLASLRACCSVRREWDRRVESGQYVPFQLTPDFLTPPPHVISLCSLCLTRASPGLPRASYAADSVPAASRVSGGRPLALRLPSALGPARSPSRCWSHPLTYRWPPLLFTTAGVLPVLPLDYLFIRIKC